MEMLVDFEEINIYGIMLEHMWQSHEMKKCQAWKSLGKGVRDTTNKMFTKATLLECECMEGQAQDWSQVAAVPEH